MSARGPTESLVDALAEGARRAEPPRLDAEKARAMVVLAAAQGALREEASAPARPWRLAVAAAACLVAGAVGGYAMRATRTSAPTQLTLATGDRLVSAPGARYAVRSADPSSRRVTLSAGAVLFDVARLGVSQRFVVETDDAQVTVLGTVFTVSVEPQGTVVRVYEGRVAVRGSSGEATVAAGHLWRSRRVGVEPRSGGPLEREALAAAALRARRPVAVASVSALPAVEGARLATAPVREVVAPRETVVARAVPVPSAVSERPWAARERPAPSAAASAPAPASADLRSDEQRGDALRAQGDDRAAAEAYELAARNHPERGGALWLLAAQLRARSLGDPEAALATLDRGGLWSRRDTVGERALVLRVRCLQALGRTGEARDAAARYLTTFPEGAMAEELRVVAAPSAP